MSKYKVGDRVRIVSFMGNDHSPLTGITGRVMDTPGYGNIVRLDRAVKIHEPMSGLAHDLLLIIDSELEYEDNKRNAIRFDLMVGPGDYVFTETMYQCEGEIKWFLVSDYHLKGDAVIQAECPRCISQNPVVVIPRTDVDHFGYLCNQPSLPDGSYH